MPNKPPDLLLAGPSNASVTIVLAHGAGMPRDAPFMTHVASGLAAHGYQVARFNFPYMDKIQDTGKRRPPDRAPVLLQTWRDVIAGLRANHGVGQGADQGAKTLIIGGKSLGGRIASLVADETSISGLVALGYPFHPPGNPQKTRTEHLATLRTPTLICQGTRDPLGTVADVAGYELSPSIRLHWLEDGDHGFKPRKASGRTEAQNLEEAVAAAAMFIQEKCL